MTKIIFHIDVNNAFLSWTAVKKIKEGYYDIRLVPSAISGARNKRRGIVLAKSEIAKKYKIQTAETLSEAKRKCSELEVYPPDYKLYEEESKKLVDLLSQYSPKVYQYSIDESFLDYTGMEKLLGEPLVFASRLKQEIANKFGWTVNIGIGNNLICAKMASDFSKPNKIHTLYQDEIEQKLWPLAIDKLFMVGRATNKTLKMMGIKTIKDLALFDKKIIMKMFKKQGDKIHAYAWGKGEDKIEAFRPLESNKSISAEKTLSQDSNNYEELIEFLEEISIRLSKRMFEENVYAYGIGLIIKDYKFKRSSFQTTLINGIKTKEEIFKYSKVLLENNYNYIPIRLIGIKLFSLDDKNDVQLSLFDDSEKVKKNENIYHVIEKIKTKHGDNIIKYADEIIKEKTHDNNKD